MNKWTIYWMLHFVGFAGMMTTLAVLQMELIPAQLMGALGGLWFAGCLILARWLVMRSKVHNARGQAPQNAVACTDELERVERKETTCK